MEACTKDHVYEILSLGSISGGICWGTGAVSAQRPHGPLWAFETIIIPSACET